MQHYHSKIRYYNLRTTMYYQVLHCFVNLAENCKWTKIQVKHDMLFK
jgi:hypothetical protein